MDPTTGILRYQIPHSTPVEKIAQAAACSVVRLLLASEDEIAAAGAREGQTEAVAEAVEAAGKLRKDFNAAIKTQDSVRTVLSTSRLMIFRPDLDFSDIGPIPRITSIPRGAAAVAAAARELVASPKNAARLEYAELASKLFAQ